MWWARSEPRIRKVASKFFFSVDDYNDLAQDIALAAFARFEDFRDEFSFANWVTRRAHWIAIDRWRQSRTRRFTPLDEAKIPVPDTDSGSQLDDLLIALEKLPRGQRTVLELTREGLPTKDIAKRLGITEASVRSLRRHARYTLAKLLNPET